MNIFIKTFTFISLLILTGCINLHNGTSTSNLPFSPKDKWVDTPMVKVKNVKFMGLGNPKKSNLFILAKNKLHKEYLLKDGEYFLNYSYDKKQYFIFGFVFIVNKVALQADVYSSDLSRKSINEQRRELLKLDSTKNVTELKKMLNSGITTPNNQQQFVIGADTLIVDENYILFKSDIRKDLVLVSVNGTELTFAEKLNSYKVYRLNTVENIYSMSGSKNGFVIGEQIKAKPYSVWEDAFIVGLNARKLLLKSGSYYFTKDFTEVKKSSKK